MVTELADVWSDMKVSDLFKALDAPLEPHSIDPSRWRLRVMLPDGTQADTEYTGTVNFGASVLAVARANGYPLACGIHTEKVYTPTTVGGGYGQIFVLIVGDDRRHTGYAKAEARRIYG